MQNIRTIIFHEDFLQFLPPNKSWYRGQPTIGSQSEKAFHCKQTWRRVGRVIILKGYLAILHRKHYSYALQRVTKSYLTTELRWI